MPRRNKNKPSSKRQRNKASDEYGIVNAENFDMDTLRHILTILSKEYRQKRKFSLKNQKAYVEENYGVVFATTKTTTKTQSTKPNVPDISNLSKEEKAQIIIQLLS